jgi:hypothetical protein
MEPFSRIPASPIRSRWLRKKASRSLTAACAASACVFGEEAQSGISRMRQPAEGTLLHRNNFYYIGTTDANTPNGEKLVRLERSEDKNYDLDRYLESLEGKVVVISGFLDRRKITSEEGIIDLYLNSLWQIKVADR